MTATDDRAGPASRLPRRTMQGLRRSTAVQPALLRLRRDRAGARRHRAPHPARRQESDRCLSGAVHRRVRLRRTASPSRLNKSTPYLLAGVGIALCFRAQGHQHRRRRTDRHRRLAATCVALVRSRLPACGADPRSRSLAGAAGGAAWAGVAAVIRLTRGVHEVLVHAAAELRRAAAGGRSAARAAGRARRRLSAIAAVRADGMAAEAAAAAPTCISAS